jgi:hypothetical protein
MKNKSPQRAQRAQRILRKGFFNAKDAKHAKTFWAFFRLTASTFTKIAAS